MKDIINFFEFDTNVLTGGQPSEGQIKALKENGVEVMINLSPSSTRNYLANEAEIAEKNGFIYFHLPVDCSNLQEYHFNSFKSVLNSVDGKKVFIHCGGNIKSSNLMHMYNVIEKGEDEGLSFDQLNKIQYPEDKWDGYFKKFGMKGFVGN